MSGFDEWWEENYMMLSADRTEAEDIYNIGAQSRQAEIDNLIVKLESIDKSSRECLSAISLSCGHYLDENKKLLKVIEDIKTYLAEAPNKHVSQTAMLKVLDILDILKGNES